MTIRRYVVNITSDAAGDATVYSQKISGYLVSLNYVKTDFANGVDFVVTGETSGETFWAEDATDTSLTRYPRAATHTTAGAAALYAGGGTAVNAKIAIGGERVKVVVDGAGDTKTGVLHITVDG